MELEGRKASLTALSQILQEQSQIKAEIEKFNRINKIFVDLQNRTERRTVECINAFQRYVGKFDIWLQLTFQRLDSGEIVTTDILQFEDDLMVCPSFVLCVV